VFALYTAVRCSVEGVTPSAAAPPLAAGAVAVAVATALDPGRLKFLRSYYTAALGLPAHVVSKPLLLTGAALSGAATLGVADWALHAATGLRW
jgi:hypothetical protein